MWPFFTRFSRGERSKGANLNAIVRRPFKFTATLAAVTRLLLRCLSERTRKQNGANKGPPHGISKQKMNCAHRQIHFYLSPHAAEEDEKPMHFTASAPVLRRQSAQRDPAASKTHKSQSRRKSQRHFSSACFFSFWARSSGNNTNPRDGHAQFCTLWLWRIRSINCKFRKKTSQLFNFL